MRISFEQAVELGLMTAEEVKAAKQHAQKKPGRRKRRRDKKSSRTIQPEELKDSPWCPIEGTTPQQKLWRAICARWPQRAVWEAENLIPNRKFKVDIYFPDERLAIEVDGFQYHGKYLGDFKKDRLKQNQFVINGYRVLRFFAVEIHQEIEAVLEIIEQGLAATE